MSPDRGGDFPEKIDFRNFIPPTEATRSTFTDTLSTLAQFATSLHSTVTRVVYVSTNTQDTVDVTCKVSKLYKYENRKKEDNPLTGGSLIIQANLGGEAFALNPINDSPDRDHPRLTVMDDRMREFIHEINSPSQAQWLRGAYHDARKARLDLLEVSAVHLIETSPIPAVEIKTHFGVNEGRKFINGAKIEGVWEEIDLKDFQGPRAYYGTTSFFGIDTPDGKSYSYIRRADGKEQLNISEKIIAQYLTVGEIADDFQAGVSNLTDGSLIDFTQALQTAIASGVPPEK